MQTLRVLLSSKSVDVNALNSSGCTALDILYVLPYSGKIDKQIVCMLQKAGAMRARDLINKQRSGCQHCHRSTRASSNSVLSSKNVLLLTATLLAATSYQVTLNHHGGGSSNFRKGYVYNYVTSTIQINKQVFAISSSILLFNSIAFLTSLSMAVYLLHEFPLKPWPQISVFSLAGSYVYSVMADVGVSPNEALAVLFLSLPFLMLAAIMALKMVLRNNNSQYNDNKKITGIKEFETLKPLYNSNRFLKVWQLLENLMVLQDNILM